VLLEPAIERSDRSPSGEITRRAEKRRCDAALLATAQAIAAAMTGALRSGNKILLAAMAAAPQTPSISRLKSSAATTGAARLGCDRADTDSSALTAVANDYDFGQVFARQIEGLGQRGDVLLALSTSGRSPNILTALRTARARGSSPSASPAARAKRWARCAITCLSRPAMTPP